MTPNGARVCAITGGWIQIVDIGCGSISRMEESPQVAGSRRVIMAELPFCCRKTPAIIARMVQIRPLKSHCFSTGYNNRSNAAKLWIYYEEA